VDKSPALSRAENPEAAADRKEAVGQAPAATADVSFDWRAGQLIDCPASLILPALAFFKLFRLVLGRSVQAMNLPGIHEEVLDGPKLGSGNEECGIVLALSQQCDERV
jgi:hypothetical protein